jgi:hypothetical protein
MVYTEVSVAELERTTRVQPSVPIALGVMLKTKGEPGTPPDVVRLMPVILEDARK